MSTLNFQMPEIIELDEGTYCATYGKFFVHPLERGFGVTIGNSLRRVLLASLQGAAISSVRIETEPAVLHEFSTIPGVIEDVAEIVLNLKEVRLKLLNKRPNKVTLSFKGAGEFTAADLQKGNTDFGPQPRAPCRDAHRGVQLLNRADDQAGSRLFHRRREP